MPDKKNYRIQKGIIVDFYNTLNEDKIKRISGRRFLIKGLPMEKIIQTFYQTLLFIESDYNDRLRKSMYSQTHNPQQLLESGYYESRNLPAKPIRAPDENYLGVHHFEGIIFIDQPSRNIL